MKLLLDTHVFLWWVSDEGKISQSARNHIASGKNEVYFSAVSSWEISIKSSLDKIVLKTPIDEFIPEQLVSCNFRPLPIEVAHTVAVAELPDHHRDPFDRLLVAQSVVEKMSLVSNDSALSQYDIDLVW